MVLCRGWACVVCRGYRAQLLAAAWPAATADARAIHHPSHVMLQTIKLKVPRVVADKMKQMEAAKEAAKEAKEGRAEAGTSSAADADAETADSSSSSSGAGAGLKQRSLSITSEGVSIKVIDLLDIAGGESSSSSSSESDDSSSSSVASSAAEQPQAQQQAAGPSEAAAPAAAAAGATPPVGAVAAGTTAAAAGEQQEMPDEDLVEIEKKIPVRGKQHPLLAALYRAQMVSSRLSCAAVGKVWRWPRVLHRLGRCLGACAV